MRLTAELVQKSLSYLNPLKERELDLRGHKIPTIENLGIAKDQESIDLTDNDIQSLTGFPLSPRLQTLLLARNRISNIQPGLAKTLPNLRTLVLSENQITELADLDPLQDFTKLVYVSLLENPVTSKEVKDAERKRGIELFGSFDAPTDLARNIIAARSSGSTFRGTASVNGTSRASRLKLTEKEKQKLEMLIKNAKTLSEVQKYEKALAEGRLPPGLADGDLMDET